MRITEHAPLAPRTTLRIGGAALRLVEAATEEEIVETVRECDRDERPVLILGGGSNLLVGDDGFDGTVVAIASRGIERTRDEDHVRLDVAAGERWDDLVANCASDGLSGLECLSGIPGLVGSTPIQNVGAYGQDVSESVASVRALDRKTGQIVTMNAASCRFAYRQSAFKGNERHVILGVTFVLAARADSAPLRYAELTRALGVAEGGRAPLEAVRQAVIRLRRAKGMVHDPRDGDSISAGSFFTNPIVPLGEVLAIEARAALRSGETMPRFPDASGSVKLSAGWLIERAGFPRGYGLGRAGISSKHALALVNRGGATARELLDLAREIRDGVRGAFGVELVPEPVFVGARL